MGFTVKKLMVDHDTDSNGMNSFGFRQFFESYVHNIVMHSSTRAVMMTPIDSVRFKGDLSGWLLLNSIPYDYHWFIARLNGYLDPTAFDSKKLSILIPSSSYIDNLLTMYKNSIA